MQRVLEVNKHGLDHLHNGQEKAFIGHYSNGDLYMDGCHPKWHFGFNSVGKN